jgi:hypothetical protein
MEQNPYEAPRESSIREPRQRTERQTGVLLIIATTFFSGALGSALLAPFVRGPGDPEGYSIAAGLGGFIGLILSVVLLNAMTTWNVLRH